MSVPNVKERWRLFRVERGKQEVRVNFFSQSEPVPVEENTNNEENESNERMNMAESTTRVVDNGQPKCQQCHSADRYKVGREWTHLGITTLTFFVLIYYACQTQIQARANVKAAEATKVAAAATVAQVEVAKNTLKTTVESIRVAQRAWIAPGSASLDEPLIVGQKVGVTITYGNPGREPARNFIMSEPISSIVPLSPGGWEMVSFGENKTCEKIKPVEGGPSIFPAGPHDFRAHYVSVDEKKVVTEDLITGASELFVMGCFQYDTFHEHHWSAFCFFLDPEKGVDSKKWHFKFCPSGNYAD